MSKTPKQTVRKLKPIPPKLDVLLDLMRFVPPHKELPPLDAPSLMYRAWEDEEGVREGQSMILRCLKGLPSDFRGYIWRPEEAEGDLLVAVEEAVERYESFCTARRKLRELAAFAQSGGSGMKVFLERKHEYTIYKIDQDGVIRVIKDIFDEAVTGVEARRIRECGQCHRIFWAGRMDQQGCSPRCANAIRQQKKRARYAKDAQDRKWREYRREQRAAAKGERKVGGDR